MMMFNYNGRDYRIDFYYESITPATHDQPEKVEYGAKGLTDTAKKRIKTYACISIRNAPKDYTAVAADYATRSLLDPFNKRSGKKYALANALYQIKDHNFRKMVWDEFNKN